MGNNVLVIGSGGREHALAWKFSQSDYVDKVYVAPGNGGTATESPRMQNVDLDPVPLKYPEIKDFVEKNDIGLTVIGPETLLVDGIVNYFEDSGLVSKGHRIFGPRKEAARLEGSKVFAKLFMQKYNIPTANFEFFDHAVKAQEYVKEIANSNQVSSLGSTNKSVKKFPLVVKADGLAEGKGSIVCKSLDEALKAIDRIMIKKEFNNAGNKIIIEDFIEGEEASILALTDGNTILALASSQDHKQAYDNDQGPNTGGMGAYAPAPIVNGKVMKKVYSQILNPTIKNLKNDGIIFQGCLYAGLMIKDNQPRVVEFNVRFGDPETQPVLMLLRNDLYTLLNACTTKTLKKYRIKNNPGSSCCVVMASKGYPEKYKKGEMIQGLDKAKDLPGVKVFHAGTKEDKENMIVLTNGGRVLGITSYADNIQSSISKAYDAIKIVGFHSEYFRKDIGKKALKK